MPPLPLPIRLTLAVSWLVVLMPAPCAAQALPNPVMFVTQMPIPGDFATIASVFGNHRADTAYVGRGGDLYIQYPDGTLRNLTREAGFGTAGEFQGTTSIAVRDPVVHWSGTRAAFAMVVGAPAAQFDTPPVRWQLYEVTGLAKNAVASIVKVPHQPSLYNNVEPAYASDGDLVFVSDRPLTGAANLYPQLDEYETRAITSGLWRLDAAGGALTLLQHSPSGSFSPIVDSFGRVVYTRWDHLQRDQQSDVANPDTFNFAGEATEQRLQSRAEVFPAPRNPVAGSNELGHTFNQMFPWQIHQDGTGEETLNHLGRHELLSYFRRSMAGDAALVDFESPVRTNRNPISFSLQMREDPTRAGRFYATDSREFEEHASGQLIRFDAPPATNAGDITIEYLTSRKTYCCHENVPENTGHYRNPLPLSDGTVLASHTHYRGTATNLGTRANPSSPFKFRVTRLKPSGAFLAPDTTLTAGDGLSRKVSYWDPDVLVTYDGPYWELGAVEVRARPVPPVTAFSLPAVEAGVFADESVDVGEFREFMTARNLGLVVMRNVTTRDSADLQQPYNLRVPGGTSTVDPGLPQGRVYDIARMQFFQGDLIRGGGGTAEGRRVLAQFQHDAAAAAANGAQVAGSAPSSTPIHPDGSAAYFVPTRRALAWQSIAPGGEAVVRERFWITVQPGEIRACDGCHGVNHLNQAGQPAAVTPPQALRALLQRWKQDFRDRLFRNGFESP